MSRPRLVLCILYIILVTVVCRQHTLQTDHDDEWHVPKLYHTTDDILDTIENLDCPQAHIEVNRRTTVSRVHIKGHKHVSGRDKVVIFFGEHARELISSETGLHFVKLLCGQEQESRMKTKNILQHYEFVIYPVVNARSRKIVEEQGLYCLRTDPEGVDLNRNWDDHWIQSVQSAQYSGNKPFSEKETQFLRDEVTDLKPKAFLSVHSGARALFTPYAYEFALPDSDSEQVGLQILSELRDKYCEQCSAGGAAQSIQYTAPGTALDYMWDKLKTPFSIGAEIYMGDEVLNVDEEEAWEVARFRQVRNRFRSRGRFPKPDREEARSCFRTFNPPSEGLYNNIVNNWSHAFIDLFDRTSQFRS